MALFYRLSGWIGILIYAALIYEMLRLWIAPTADDTARILTLAVMMGFEFIMVHSGVFMAVFPRKISLFIFVPIYGLFAWSFNSMVPGNEILYLYLGVVFVRMRFAFSNATEKEKSMNMLMSLIAVMSYFFLILIFAFNSERIPKMGLTPEFLESSGYLKDVAVGGIFTDMPNVPLAMGVIYFTLLAYSEIKIYKLLTPLSD